LRANPGLSAQLEMSKNKEKYSPSVSNVRQTHKFKKVIKYVTNGHCETPEKIIFTYDNKIYAVDFICGFSYDDQNGLHRGRDSIVTILITDKHTKKIVIYAKEEVDSNSDSDSDSEESNDKKMIKKLALYAIENLFKTYD
jgi:hypothetical protein